MKIEIATKTTSSTKEKGDLLENLVDYLLKTQNYDVEKEVRKTGVELDLLCRHKANKNKIIYVECKAYRDSKNIDANIIYNLIGKKTQKKYDEAWLISTCEFGKEAKGVVDELYSEGTKDLSFYTPDKLTNALVDAKIIVHSSVAKHTILETVNQDKLIDDPFLLVTEIGLFWASKYKKGSKYIGVLFADARDGNIVEDLDILTEVSELDSTLSGLNFFQITTIDGALSDKNHRFRFDDDYLSSIKDTGVMYTHPNKHQLDKDDLFLFPDLQIVNEEDKVNSSRLTILSNDNKKNIIFGEELSGKTTLAQKLQRVYLDSGYIPVYLNACNINSVDRKKLTRQINTCLKQQYTDVTKSVIDSINKDLLILIIDDFHNIKLNKNNYTAIVKVFNELFRSIIYFCNSNRELEILANDQLASVLTGYGLYRIKELGFKLRDDMISNWISIGKSDLIDENEKHKQILEISEVINSTVGRNFVPTYPIYILTLLQSFEASTVKSLQGSAYAEFYNYLITHALGSAGVKANELDLFYSFLSELSYKFFSAAEKDISDNGFEDFYKEFCSRKMIDNKYEKTKSILLRSKILKSDNDIFWFNHSYIYYFFVARYLSENSSKNEIRSQILALTKRLYLSEFANVVLFLVHFSKDRFILNSVIEEARSVFVDIKITTLNKDEFTNINNLIERELKLIIEDKVPADARKEEMQMKDELHDSSPKDPVSECDYKSDIKDLDVFGQINLGFKLIEILGQITKNYYGSLDGEIKIKLLEETYNLGLRSLNKLMSEFDEYTGLLEEEISRIIIKKDLATESEVASLSKKLIFEFASMISFAFIAKIANSVASKDLRSIYRAVYDKDTQLSKKLINTAIDLDFYNGLDTNEILNTNNQIKGNNLAAMLLRLIVTRHMYKFNIPFDKRQKICQKLNIGVDNQKKMLASNK